MRIRHALAIIAALSICGVSDAALRTFEINFDGIPAVGPIGTTLDFEYDDGAFSDNIVSLGTDLTSSFDIQYADAPGVDFTLSLMSIDPLNSYLFQFFAPDSSKVVVQFNSAVFQVPSGTDLPDGVETFARSNYFDAGGALVSQSFPSITIGTATAAVPEPSAFGFGALALTATGLGRWARRRFFVA